MQNIKQTWAGWYTVLRQYFSLIVFEKFYFETLKLICKNLINKIITLSVATNVNCVCEKRT